MARKRQARKNKRKNIGVAKMIIGGFQKLSLIDYPNKLAAIIFTCGCNFKCPFCYNVPLIKGKIKKIPLGFIFSYLEQRRKFLDAVVFTGGEPTLHADLPQVCKKLKQMGFLVKLDTNGSNPEMLRQLIEKKLLDYIAMDIKTSFQKYKKVCEVDIKKIKQSINIIKKLESYEFRTTCVPGIVTQDDLLEIAQYLKANKANKAFFLQQFLPKRTLNKEFEKIKPYSVQQLENFKQKLKPFFQKVEIRK